MSATDEVEEAAKPAVGVTLARHQLGLEDQTIRLVGTRSGVHRDAVGNLTLAATLRSLATVA
jgi:hypothetical protein